MIDVYVGNNGARFHFADYVAGDDFFSPKGLPMVKSSLALAARSRPDWGFGDGRGDDSGNAPRLAKNGDVPRGVHRQNFRGNFALGIELDGDQFRGPMTCWLVITRPPESTMNPVPDPISLHTVTTDFWYF